MIAFQCSHCSLNTAGQHAADCPANPKRTVCTAQLTAPEKPQLPPLPSHPDSQGWKWTELELRAIEKYGRACQEAARAPLLAEIERLKKSAEGWKDCADAYQADADELRAQLEAARKDAERWRTLVSLSTLRASHLIDKHGSQGLAYVIDKETAAIDAARRGDDECATR